MAEFVPLITAGIGLFTSGSDKPKSPPPPPAVPQEPTADPDATADAEAARLRALRRRSDEEDQLALNLLQGEQVDIRKKTLGS